MITTRRAVYSGLALAGTTVLLAGCATAPTSSSNTPAVSGFKPCMVSDSGGFDDKSFNQLGYEGLQKAASELGVAPITVQSNAETDYAPNLTNLVDQDCKLIVTVGFALASAAGQSAAANPSINYVSIDDPVDTNNDGKTDSPNIKPILFDTAQAAFLAGYTAAAYSKTGIVGTFGGMNFPTVTIFMDGFKQGVDYYNTNKGTAVKVLGWNGTDGLFTGGFEANDIARNTAQGLIDQNVDVLLPVGGPIYQSAAAAVRDSGRDIAMIGVDADLTVTDPSVANLILTSILKGIDVGTYDAVISAGRGSFSNTPFVGTLQNNGVGVAPFHDFVNKVPSGLQGELDSLKSQIMNGSIKVNSYLAS